MTKIKMKIEIEKGKVTTRTKGLFPLLATFHIVFLPQIFATKAPAIAFVQKEVLKSYPKQVSSFVFGRPRTRRIRGRFFFNSRRVEELKKKNVNEALFGIGSGSKHISQPKSAERRYVLFPVENKLETDDDMGEGGIVLVLVWVYLL